ncbi:MAG: hypothetical protein P8X82_02020 [Gemmatimonadales bacterium]
MKGCLKNLLAGVGCATVLAVVGGLTWHFRADLGEVYRTLVDGAGSGAAPSMTVGRPSSDQLQSAESKESDIAERSGPDQIVLSADEMASIVQDRLAPGARRALDSLKVVLERDRLSIQADLLTEVFGRDLLGPLQGIIDPREPIRVSGTAGIKVPGVVAWTIDEFVISSFPFPGPAIPVLVDRLTGGSDGVILISVPPTVGDLRIRTEGVTFYRRAS